MTSEKTIIKRLEFENKDFRQPKVKTQSPQPLNGTFYSKVARGTVFYPYDLPEEEKENHRIKYDEEYLKRRKYY